MIAVSALDVHLRDGRTFQAGAELGELFAEGIHAVGVVDAHGRHDGASTLFVTVELRYGELPITWVEGAVGEVELPTTWGELHALLERTDPPLVAVAGSWVAARHHARSEAGWEHHFACWTAVAGLEPADARRVAMVLLADGWTHSPDDLVVASRACVSVPTARPTRAT